MPRSFPRWFQALKTYNSSILQLSPIPFLMRELIILLLITTAAFAQEIGVEEQPIEHKSAVIRPFKDSDAPIEKFTKTKVNKFQDTRKIRDIAFYNSGLSEQISSLDTLDRDILFKRAKGLSLDQMYKFYPDFPKDKIKVFVEEVKREMPWNLSSYY